MKVIEFSPAAPQNTSQLSGLVGSIQQALGLSGQTDRHAEDLFTNSLKGLPSPWTLLRNLNLEGASEPVPLLLIGPQGIFVIIASAPKGVYQVKDDSWLEMKGANKFVPGKPNQIARVTQAAKAVSDFISKQGYEIPEIQPVLFFSDPGTHIDSVRPAVRIVLADGINGFVTGIMLGEATFTNEDVLTLVRLFETLKQVEPEEEPVEEEVEEAPEPVKPAPKPQQPRKESAAYKKIDQAVGKMSFSRKQWAALAIIAVLYIILLIVAFFLLVAYT